MGFLGKASDFFAAPGAAVGSFVGDALHNASNFVCQLHYNTPGVIFDVSPFNRELWREFCKERPAGLPSSEPPFKGGQCPVVYVPHLYYEVAHVGGAVFFSETIARESGVGPVLGVELRRDPTYTYLSIKFANNGNPYYRDYSIVANSAHEFRNARIVRVDRPDGQPDNCGNPPVPPVTPVVLPVSQRTTNIVVTNIENKTTNVSLVVDFPSAAVDFSFNPMLRVTIDNRKFYLNVDGWYSGEPSVSADLPNIENVFSTTLNQYFAPINPSINNNLILVSPSAGKKKGGEEKDISGAQWLIWDLTRLPDKAQYGENSPTVYFAGWFSFYKEGRCMERRQINYERGIVRFPDGADGYGYTFTNGAEGDVSVYKEKPQNG